MRLVKFDNRSAYAFMGFRPGFSYHYDAWGSGGGSMVGDPGKRPYKNKGRKCNELQLEERMVLIFSTRSGTHNCHAFYGLLRQECRCRRGVSTNSRLGRDDQQRIANLWLCHQSFEWHPWAAV